MPDIMSFGKHPDYMGAIDLTDCPNGEVTLTIASITEKKVSNGRGESTNESVCAWQEKGWMPMILNVTNKKVLVKLYKTKDTAKLVGKRVTIYAEHGRWFGKEGDALRIRPVVPTAPKQSAPAKDAPKCAECGKPIAAAGGMNPEQVAQYTAKKYNKPLCGECATKAASAAKDGAE
jgi:hypothetical protein